MLSTERDEAGRAMRRLRVSEFESVAFAPSENPARSEERRDELTMSRTRTSTHPIGTRDLLSGSSCLWTTGRHRHRTSAHIGDGEDTRSGALTNRSRRVGRSSELRRVRRLRSLVVRSIGFLGSLALARLLSPGDFGYLALGLSLTAVGQFLSNGGLGWR